MSNYNELLSDKAKRSICSDVLEELTDLMLSKMPGYNPKESEWITADEVREEYYRNAISRETILKWGREGKLKATKENNKLVLFQRQSVEDRLNS